MDANCSLKQRALIRVNVKDRGQEENSVCSDATLWMPTAVKNKIPENIFHYQLVLYLFTIKVSVVSIP